MDNHRTLVEENASIHGTIEGMGGTATLGTTGEDEIGRAGGTDQLGKPTVVPPTFWAPRGAPVVPVRRIGFMTERCVLLTLEDEASYKLCTRQEYFPYIALLHARHDDFFVRLLFAISLFMSGKKSKIDRIEDRVLSVVFVFVFARCSSIENRNQEPASVCVHSFVQAQNKNLPACFTRAFLVVISSKKR